MLLCSCVWIQCGSVTVLKHITLNKVEQEVNCYKLNYIHATVLIKLQPLRIALSISFAITYFIASISPKHQLHRIRVEMHRSNRSLTLLLSKSKASSQPSESLILLDFYRAVNILLSSLKYVLELKSALGYVTKCAWIMGGTCIINTFICIVYIIYLENLAYKALASKGCHKGT